ncbi:hypothetical protein EYF80_010619 [Liparis tanakae]|uniref:Uncharacterized protein n=1 Tax=Liparis tanakae TaxID=230148 RepID=A0A4Z2IN08_9TELE|nr:hypothetical protein EYF80_010619 [Liparis tanakae]
MLGDKRGFGNDISTNKTTVAATRDHETNPFQRIKAFPTRRISTVSRSFDIATVDARPRTLKKHTEGESAGVGSGGCEQQTEEMRHTEPSARGAEDVTPS